MLNKFLKNVWIFGFVFTGINLIEKFHVELRKENFLIRSQAVKQVAQRDCDLLAKSGDFQDLTGENPEQPNLAL